MQLTKNFTLSEFECKSGAAIPDELLPNIKKLAESLQVLRDDIGLPIRINSGYRSLEHNDKIGGVKNSQHLKGTAADIAIIGKTSREIRRRLEILIKSGKMLQGGIGSYSTFTHYDIRGYKARWRG